MPIQAQNITIPPAPDWLTQLASMAQEYIPDLLSRDMAETPAAGLMPEYAKDWLQGLAVNPSEMMYESLTNQMGGGQPLAQIAERSGAKNLGAFLHRTMDPDELKFVDKLMERGGHHERAASVITPTYRSIFHPTEPQPGLVFSVANPENIKWWAPNDVFSFREGYGGTKEWLKKIERLMEREGGRSGRSSPKVAKYQQAWQRVQKAPWREPRNERVMPGLDYEDADYPLNRILSRQQRRLEELAREDPNMESTPFFELLNEVGYKMDPSEIVGVRVPRLPKEPIRTAGMTDQQWMDLAEQYYEPAGLVEPALDFAKRHNLPIWQFSPQLTPGEAAQGIADYLGTPGMQDIIKDQRRRFRDWAINMQEQEALGPMTNLERLSQIGHAPQMIPESPSIPGQWYRRRTEEFPMGLVESTADPLAAYYGKVLRR